MKSATLVFCEEFHWTSLFSAKNLTGQADQASTFVKTMARQVDPASSTRTNTDYFFCRHGRENCVGPPGGQAFGESGEANGI